MRRRNRQGTGTSARIGAVIFGALAGMAVGILLADRGTLFGAKKPRTGRTRSAPDDPGQTTDEMEAVRPLREARPPRKAANDEAALEARVLETFRNDPVLADRPIDIGAIGTGIIELTGWVDKPEEVRHATTLTRGTIGVHTVVNRLFVREAGQSA